MAPVNDTTVSNESDDAFGGVEAAADLIVDLEADFASDSEEAAEVLVGDILDDKE